MAPPVFKHTFNHSFKGEVEVPLGLYIGGKYVDSVDKNAKTIP